MQLQRLLSLAALAAGACALAPVSGFNFSDTGDRDLNNNAEERIFGGTEADASKYPYIASIRKSETGSTYCGGALVAPQYILTAAHCVKEGQKMFVSLGSRYGSGDKEGERIAVAQSTVHPGYDKPKHLNDVAVLKLEKPSTVKPVPLCNPDGSDNKENTMAVVRGWGLTETNVASDTLLEVNVKIRSNAECNKEYNNRITEGMICAGNGGNKDSCQGDSGGPLVSNDVLIGVVSWGGKCGANAGVYSRVTFLMDWIKEQIGNGPTQSPATTTPAPSTTAPTPSTTAPTPSTTAPPATTTPAPSTTTPTTTSPMPSSSAPASNSTTPSPSKESGDDSKPDQVLPTPTKTLPGKDTPNKGGNTTPLPGPLPTPLPTKGKDVTPAPSTPSGGKDQTPAPTPSKTDSKGKDVTPAPSTPSGGKDQTPAPTPAKTDSKGKDVTPIPSTPSGGKDQTPSPTPASSKPKGKKDCRAV